MEPWHKRKEENKKTHTVIQKKNKNKDKNIKETSFNKIIKATCTSIIVLDGVWA